MRLKFVVALCLFALAGVHGAHLKPENAPAGFVCVPPLDTFPFCDTALSIEARLKWLVDNMTVAEKISQVGGDPHNPEHDLCTDIQAPIPRLGITRTGAWLDETNSGACSGSFFGKVATTFPSNQGIAASFNRTVWKLKGSVEGVEQRAMNNLGFTRFDAKKKRRYAKVMLTGFNAFNLLLNPYWGRSDEMASIDPYLTSEYAREYGRASQQGADPKFMQTFRFVKHTAVYEQEYNRGQSRKNVTLFNLHDSYVRNYAQIFRRNGTVGFRGVMCSYTSFRVTDSPTPINHGEMTPSCANPYLLQELLRKRWGCKHCIVTSDCGAINNMYVKGGNNYTNSNVSAAALAIRAGVDMDAGDHIFSGKPMQTAISEGLVNISELDSAVSRIFRIRFELGMFDPLNSSSYTGTSLYGLQNISSPAHQKINFDAMLQSFVLLRNDDETLPLNAIQKIALVGPKIRSRGGLFQQYIPDEVCVGLNHTFNCTQTIEEAFNAIPNTEVLSTEGFGVSSMDFSKVPDAIELAKVADVTVICLGLDHTIEEEGVDRTTTDLPGIQSWATRELIRVSKKVVIVFINGGMLSFQELLHPPMEGRPFKVPPMAFVEIFYPAFGARALAETLFGMHNKWSKLPGDIYNSDYQHVVIGSYKNPSLSPPTPPGMSYRYHDPSSGMVAFEFGHGLSYTRFSLTGCNTTMSSSSSHSFLFPLTEDDSDEDQEVGTVTCGVKNVGPREGDEVLLVYHLVGDAIRAAHADHPFPRKELVEFERVTLQAGEQTSVTWAVTSRFFHATNALGRRVVYSGVHHLVIGGPSQNVSTSWNIQ